MTNADRVRVLLFSQIRKATDKYKELAAKYHVIQAPLPSSRDQFIRDLKDHKYDDITALYSDYLFEIAINNIDEEIAANLPSSLKYIAHLGAGYDRVDAVALLNRGIQFSNTPGPVAEATATTAIYLMLGAIRNFNRFATDLRSGIWRSTEGHDPKGRVLGILGMGNIGQSIRDKAKPYHFKRILYHNRHRLNAEDEDGAEYVGDLESFLKQADIIMVSVPLNASTRHLLNEKTISYLKDGSVIVNTARGKVIDEQALVDALSSGKLYSVGLDVYEYEPKVHPQLLANPNVILLPHAGTSTEETHKEMETRVLENIEAGIDTGHVIDLVPEQKGKFAREL